MAIDVKRHTRSVGPTVPSAPTIAQGVATLPARTEAISGRRTTSEGQRQTAEGIRLQERADISTANKQLNDFEVQVKLRKNEFDAMIRENNNPETYFDEYDKFKKEIDEKILPQVDHFLAIESATTWLADSDAAWRDRLDIDQDKKATANSVASFRATRLNALENLDDELLMRTYERAVQEGIVLPEVAETQLATDLEKVDKAARAAAEEAAIDNELALARTIYDELLEQGLGEGKTQSKAESDALLVSMDFIRDSEVVPEDKKQPSQQQLRSEITARRAEESLALEDAQEKNRSDINKLMYVDKNYTLATESILASTLEEKEKRMLLKENDNRATAAARSEPETNDSVALDNVTTAIAQVGNNTLPLADAKKIYNANKAQLKSTTADTLLKELNKEFDSSVDTASAKVRNDVRLRAVGKTESALDRLLEALVGVKPDDEKTLEKRITTAKEKFNLELDNFNRWEDSQRAWRQTNNTASPDQIEKEGVRSWFTEFAGKGIDQLRRETKQFVKGFETVRVEAPDGKTGTILKSELKQAIERGWKKL